MLNIYSLPHEVTVHICSYVVVRHPVSFLGWQMDKKTLARLARTCRTLSLPALTVLWRTLPNILPLLATLPADLCAQEAYHTPDGNGRPEEHIRLERMPTSADFSRWKFYSVLVRDIKSLHETSNPPLLTVSRDVWATIALYGPKPLVPYFRALNDRDFVRGRYPLEVTRLFFSSTLVKYGLATANPEPELVSHVDALAESAPFLRKLHVSWDYGSPECVVPAAHRPRTSLSPSLRAFSYLRELSMKSIDILPSALRSIGALPSLQILDISVSIADYPPSWTSSTLRHDFDYFPQIRSLVCNVDDLALVATILEIVSSPLLERLRMDSSRSHHASFQRLCEVLSRHPSRDALRSMWHMGPLGEPCDLNAAFTYLLALPSITDICLDTSSIIMLSDDTLEAMSHAWPRLEKLDLHRYKYDPHAGFDGNFSSLEYRATLHGLSALAQNCPSLKVVTLPIDPWCSAFYSVDDVDAPGWDRDFRPVPPDRSSFVALYVGFIDPEYPLQVAGILSAIFPHLETVTYGDHDDQYRSPGWEEVNRILQGFNRVRAQERRWADGRGRLPTAESVAS